MDLKEKRIIVERPLCKMPYGVKVYKECMEYRGFVLNFYEFIPRIYAYNKNLDMSFGIGLTDIQKEVYNEMYGEESWKTILTNSMKRLIDDWLTWKE